MAEFEPAFKALLKHEGGYVNDPADHGGETYRGISRVNWRGWDGWPQIDQIKKPLNDSTIQQINAALAVNPDLQGKVKDFYRRNFWMPLMQDLANQDLSNWLFDKSVNMGVRRAYKLLQRALHVDEDGIIGQETRHGIHQMDQVALLAACREEARRFYTKLALDDPTQRRFLNGWLARA